ncbi:RNA polymerase subunit sigma-70 [Methylobacterium sp. V23]|nr:RNA polymerase subunit sigma-70 [Methylobacterium sp. V23]
MSSLADAGQEDPVLSLEVREHLGTQLRALYGSLDAFGASGPLHALMERLDAALAAYGETLTAEVRAGMAEQMPGLMRFALSLTKDRSRAEDLVQETLMRAWRSRHTYEAGTNVAGWLTMILRNTFYSHHRKRSHEVEDPDEAYAAALSIAPPQEDRLHLQDMHVAMGQLPPEQRETLVLIVLNNLSYEEAALAMGCKVGTVKSRMSRARERLSEILG